MTTLLVLKPCRGHTATPFGYFLFRFGPVPIGVVHLLSYVARLFRIGQ